LSGHELHRVIGVLGDHVRVAKEGLQANPDLNQRPQTYESSEERFLYVNGSGCLLALTEAQIAARLGLEPQAQSATPVKDEPQA
jgi:hypothetical protein